MIGGGREIDLQDVKLARREVDISPYFAMARTASARAVESLHGGLFVVASTSLFVRKGRRPLPLRGYWKRWRQRIDADGLEARDTITNYNSSRDTSLALHNMRGES
jgi:hypothetical protein